MGFRATTGSADGSVRFVLKQLVAVGIGLLSMRTLMFFDYHRLGSPNTVFLFLGLAITLLCGVLFASQTANTNRFLRLWFFSIQPSEFAKLATVLFLAHYLTRRRERLHDWRTLGASGFVITSLCGLILGGRDLGTAVLVMVIALAIFWVAGLRVNYFVTTIGTVIILMIAAVLIEPYRLERVTTFMNPEKDLLGLLHEISLFFG